METAARVRASVLVLASCLLVVVPLGCNKAEETEVDQAETQQRLMAERGELMQVVLRGRDTDARIQAASKLAEIGDGNSAMMLAAEYPRINDSDVAVAVKDAVRQIAQREDMTRVPNIAALLQDN